MNVCSLPVYDYWHPKVMRYVDYHFDPTYGCDKNFKPYTELVNGSWRIVGERKGMNCWAREPKTEPKYPNLPNVFIFMMDSLSTGAAKRSLPRTLSTLSSRLDAIEFPFVNKVGENSLPNGISLFFGKAIEKINGENYGGDNVEAEWNKTEYCDSFVNNSILEEFQEHGYITQSIDDWAQQMVMFPNCKGFDKAPTDHYMHPFYMIYEKRGQKITKQHLKGHLCREPRHPAYEYLQEFIDTYKDEPKFSFSWISTTGHNHFNGFMRVDNEMVDIIERNMKTFENSFVILMGDHGYRMARQKFMETDIGSLELNNPYLSISIPKKLRKNLELLNIMKDNSQKLQTHFDTRATLLDILKYQPESGFSNRSVLNIPYERGHSYLRRQPSFPRTCGRLPIPPEYCICQVEKVHIPDESLQSRFGNLLINHINNLMFNANFSSICQTYYLGKVISLKHHGHLNHSEPNHNYEIIVMTTAPIYAQFQTILMHNKENNEVIFGNIMRMDRYGKTGDCTKSDQFQKMCFCKNLSFYDKMEYLVKKQLREWQVIIEDMFPRIG